jgi:hypothetical protein
MPMVRIEVGLGVAEVRDHAVDQMQGAARRGTPLVLVDSVTPRASAVAGSGAGRRPSVASFGDQGGRFHA